MAIAMFEFVLSRFSLLQLKFLLVSFSVHVPLYHELHPVKIAMSCVGVPMHSVFPQPVHWELRNWIFVSKV